MSLSTLFTQGLGAGVRVHLASTTSLRPPKSEIRSPKSETSTNGENPKSQTPLRPLVLGIVYLGIGICFGFRASDFGFDLNGPVLLSRCTSGVGPKRSWLEKHPRDGIIRLVLNCAAIGAGANCPQPQGAGTTTHAISSLVSVHQRAMRSHLSAELHRVPMPAVPFAAGGAARHGGAGQPQRGGVDEALRGPLQEQRVALRLRRLGQEGMDSAADQRRQHRVGL